MSIWPKAALFDLDGTLIDSAPDICAATNELLARHGLGPVDQTAVLAMIGEGTRKLVERAFAACGKVLDQTELDARYQEMLPIYAAHLTGLTQLLPHVAEALAALDAQGTKIALVTNKPEFAIAQILDHFEITRYFPVIIGASAKVPHKPAPDMVLLALDKLGLKPADALFVGDSPADARAAQAASVKVVLVRNGYSREPLETLGADRLIDDMGGLMAAAESLAPR